MDELVKLVMAKTGLPEATAKTAVETVLGFIKQRLPEPLSGELDKALANESTIKQAEDLIENLGGLGGLFGGKK